MTVGGCDFGIPGTCSGRPRCSLYYIPINGALLAQLLPGLYFRSFTHYLSHEAQRSINNTTFRLYPLHTMHYVLVIATGLLATLTQAAFRCPPMTDFYCCASSGPMSGCKDLFISVAASPWYARSFLLTLRSYVEISLTSSFEV